LSNFGKGRGRCVLQLSKTPASKFMLYWFD